MSDQETEAPTFTPDILIQAEDGNLYYIPVGGLAPFKVDKKHPQHDFSLIDNLLSLGVDVAAVPDQHAPVQPLCTCYLLNLGALKIPERFAKAYAAAAAASQE